MRLYLVRHGRPLVDRRVPAAQWELDPAAFDSVWALRSAGRLPAAAAWFTSPEPKAVQTAQLLTEGQVGIVPGLREHERRAGWVEDFADAVARAVEEPSTPAVEGWETVDACRARVATTVRALLDQHRDRDLVLIGHGTAWMLLEAELTGRRPDLARWRGLGFPDLVELEV